uniref:Uncharacterized protein n=1 Tax=Vespula pensylvanica TaxID=30213 RepID=A0A834N7R4_VESPE|nr:hypothetical protein H0235_015697 [Vespula pensylvanica]
MLLMHKEETNIKYKKKNRERNDEAEWKVDKVLYDKKEACSLKITKRVVTAPDSLAPMLIGGAVSYVAGKQAVRTVYWRTANNGRLLKTAKTCMFQGPPKPAPSSTSATTPDRSRMDLIPRVILNSQN